MSLIGCALIDPGFECFDINFTQLGPIPRWRHTIIRIFGCDPLDQEAFSAVPWKNRCRFGFAGRDCCIIKIQAQTRLALVGIWTVALEAMLGEDGTNGLVEINRMLLCYVRCRKAVERK